MRTTAMNAFGQYTNYTTGNGLSMSKTYNQYGMPTQFLASDAHVQDLQFNFNKKNGNLNWRFEGNNGIIEEFEYDNLNRLKKTRVDGIDQFTMNYASNGNINSKTDAGHYSYDATKINAVIEASNPNTDISLLTQNITYNHFNSTATIVEDIHNLTLTYGPSEQRKKTVYTNGTALINKYFVSNYEKIVDANTSDYKEIHYIAGGDGLTAIYVSENGNPGNIHYVYTDHLGSILTLTDTTGHIEVEQNFDAWGRERDPATWDYSTTTTLVGNHTGFEWLQRGYTGHEHLTPFKLINMNGRVYDPILGRMLSVDNYVQSPLNTQSYNRYSYVINNPLKFNDPSGEAWKDIFDSWDDYLNPLKYLDAINGYNPKTGQYNGGLVQYIPGWVPAFNISGTIGGNAQTSSYLNIDWSAVDEMRFAKDYDYKAIHDEIIRNNTLQEMVVNLGVGSQIIEDLFEYGANVPLKGADNANHIKEAAAATSFKSISTYAKRIGVGANILTGYIEYNRFTRSDKSYGDIGKLTINAASIGFTYMGGVFTVAGIGLGIWDATGNADWFYYSLDIRQDMFYWHGGEKKGWYNFNASGDSPFKPK